MDINAFYKTLVKGLDWNNQLDTQNESIRSLVQSFDHVPLDLYNLFEMLDKYSWENYCRVVNEICYPKNKSAIPALLYLLQDLNWPGSESAMLILTSISKEDLASHVETTINQAYTNNDFMWLGGLKVLARKMNFTPEDFCDGEIFKLLDFADF